MGTFSVIAAILSYLFGILIMSTAAGAMQETVGALFIVNGTIFLGISFILAEIGNQVSKFKNRSEEE